MKNNIVYIEENKDFSDKWLLSFLKGYFKIMSITPEDKNPTLPLQPTSLFINRLYTSSVERYGEKNIQSLIKLIKKAEKDNIPVINSSYGYLLDLDRRKQFKWFSSKGFFFAPIVEVKSLVSGKESIKFPCVIKLNPSGRNKKLLIIKDWAEFLIKKSSLRQNVVLQPLIEEKVCYRTEFVGDWDTTYIQIINFHPTYLDFSYTNKIILTPLSKLFRKKLYTAMEEIGVYAFSIEYFLKNNLPIIVDFNLTSNYPRFFIETVGDELKKAWLNLIKNSLKK